MKTRRNNKQSPTSKEDDAIKTISTEGTLQTQGAQAPAKQSRRKAHGDYLRNEQPLDRDKKMPARLLSSIKKVRAIAVASVADKEDTNIVVLSSGDEEDDDKSVVFCGLKSASQEQMEAALLTRKQQELESMKRSHAGRSVLLVEKVTRLLEPHAAAGIGPVGKDDAVFLCEKMFQLQEKFKRAKAPTCVSIGYHYTHNDNMHSIRTDGLLTIDDRKSLGHENTRNVAFLGNGIYTGTSK